MTALRLMMSLIGLAQALVYVHARIGHASHLGCAEPALEPIEHLLLPRALWCTDERCWDEGALDFTVDALECTDDACQVALFCQPRAYQAAYGLGITLLGFALILVFVCAPQARPYAVKYHKQ